MITTKKKSLRIDKETALDALVFITETSTGKGFRYLDFDDEIDLLSDYFRPDARQGKMILDIYSAITNGKKLTYDQEAVLFAALASWAGMLGDQEEMEGF